jgi:hypothetical protein
MSPEQIADERRRGRLAAVAALIAAALFAAAAVWSQSLSNDAPERNGPALLRFFDRHTTDLVGSSTLRGVALLLLVAVTLHLYRATKARRPDEPQVVLVMGLYGPVAAGVGTIVVGIALATAASSFTDRQFQTIKAADDAFRTVQLLGLLSFSGSLALAFWFVKGCLDAMRVGLLSRVMGVVGIALGPGLVIFSGAFQFLLPVWLVAVAGLFAGFTFGAKPPAWDAGEAVAPPSARERLGEALDDGALRAAPNGEVEAVGPGVRQGDGDSGAPQKRKRKRRH